jgi:hypothetical protein
MPLITDHSFSYADLQKSFRLGEKLLKTLTKKGSIPVSYLTLRLLSKFYEQNFNIETNPTFEATLQAIINFQGEKNH